MTHALMVSDQKAVEITAEQTALIKSTICAGATDAEMQLFFYDCQRRGVHPLDKLIHFTKRSGRYVPITSIDLFYQRAHATEQFAGQDPTAFDGDPGQVGFTATVRVYRQRPGCEQAGWSATARWSEYYPGDQQGHMWKKMPHRMLEKCAEALALRKAFPAELQGLYVKEEMDQAARTGERELNAAGGMNGPPAAPSSGGVPSCASSEGAPAPELSVVTDWRAVLEAAIDLDELQGAWESIVKEKSLTSASRAILYKHYQAKAKGLQAT